MITLSQFQQMIPTNREPSEWYVIAVDMFNKYDINTTNRIASFMAQTAHESQDFRVLEENLNYSADRLVQVFPRYFGKGKEDPSQYARNPERLANYVYMDVNRSKSGALGNTQPGDGWRFRGGGIKQLTGRNNYTRFGKSIGMTAEQASDYVRTKKGAFESACWFWKMNNLARFADADDIDGMSRKINGGSIGIEDRRARYSRAKTIMNATPRVQSFPTPVNSQITDSVTQRPTTPPATPRPPAPTAHTTMRRGSTGETVRRIQSKLGLAADGVFGLQTEVAVRSWQRTNKYPSNGVLDSEQVKKLLGE
jgi:putative chitinase